MLQKRLQKDHRLRKKLFWNLHFDQKKYQLLLKSTNQLAEGQLDLPIEGDVGIFRPIQDELKKYRQMEDFVVKAPSRTKKTQA